MAGQVALVTGSGSGMGRATALEMASCGARLALFARREEPLKET
ncbi:MAG: SDR family NAD(P)-dependent oxidoreductase, partial [Sulfitobacter pontiacus]